MDKSDIAKLQAYLQKKFGNPGLSVRERRVADSAEVYLNGEAIGTVYKDDDEGEISYDFNMSILDIDIEEI
ncbi:MAG: DUF3126 family protein [Alphaproteobacteria bacterium]|nr:DUF3126 family protein [Alphaproteobacteria bacterium]MCB1550916.1 DUF3126 family protein [Alphaproteobacteria bacterium]MCB9984339.1 DUF3126 family protein [Micavibrio sp.]HRK97895.1 DUF3126 family protein [Alphaproteobacteria bacterium]